MQAQPKFALLRRSLPVSPPLRPFSQVARDNGQHRRQRTKREIKWHCCVTNHTQVSISKNGSSFPETLLLKGPFSLEKAGVSLRLLQIEEFAKPHTALLGVSICWVAMVLDDSGKHPGIQEWEEHRKDFLLFCKNIFLSGLKAILLTAERPLLAKA